MSDNYDPMWEHIKDSRQKLAKDGVANSDSKDVMLAGFGWLADRIAPVGNGRLRRKAVQAAVPTATGGGVVAIVLYVLQLFAR